MVVLRTQGAAAWRRPYDGERIYGARRADDEFHADEAARRWRRCRQRTRSGEGAEARRKRFWTAWSQRNTYRGPYAEAVKRSLITLKALTYRPSGGIVAAATTSSAGADWRDAQLGLSLLLAARYVVYAAGADAGGYQEEAVAWRRWLLRAIAGAPDQVQTIYGICGRARS